nr:hypothetical protein 22 [bacterium]
MTTYQFTLPDHWASAFINNDWTGIEDTEEEKCMLQFLSDNPGLICIDVRDDSSFVKYHDAADYGVLASDCSTFVFN